MLATNCDGFYTGYWNDGFQMYSDPTIAQDDGDILSFYIKTFAGIDFISPLYMKLKECDFTNGSCRLSPLGSGWGNLKGVQFPQ